MASKSKKAVPNVKRCFKLGCEETLKATMIYRSIEPKFRGITFECPKCGRFDRSGNKLNF